jgi:hypothetical protein
MKEPRKIVIQAVAPRVDGEGQIDQDPGDFVKAIARRIAATASRIVVLGTAAKNVQTILVMNTHLAKPNHGVHP